MRRDGHARNFSRLTPLAVMCALVVCALLTTPASHADSPYESIVVDTAAMDHDDLAAPYTSTDDSVYVLESEGLVDIDSIVARYPVAKIFTHLPLDVLDILPRSVRDAMVLFHTYEPNVRVTNGMDGQSRIISLTPEQLEAQVTDVSTIAIRMLPLKNGKSIAMTIYTIGTDDNAGDSEISFYDEECQPLPAEKFFTIPEVRDFLQLPKGSKNSLKSIADMVPFPTIIYTFEGGDAQTPPTLVATLTVGKYLSVEDYKTVKSAEKAPLRFAWNGKWKPLKQ